MEIFVLQFSDFDTEKHFDTVHSRHADVEQYEIEALLLKFVYGIGTVFRRCDVMALWNEERLQEHPEILLVVGDEYVCAIFLFCHWVCVCVWFLRLTVHGQVGWRFHLAGRVGGPARVHARILRVCGLNQQYGMVTFLDHL